ncbi:SAICAR synthase-like protein [Marasmius fiardii PR-910]|nr:SAICAR synthase-like protein [Marasmius fiardii PR-910]
MSEHPTTSTGATVPLTSQVGGHAGVQTTEDGSLIIKPALALEHEFYQSLTTQDSFQALRPFVPKFYGTLKLEGQVDESGEGGGIKELGTSDIDSDNLQSLVLENLLHTFVKPNILDIKLGTVLYDESASPEKVERMLKIARETTSLETGIRLTGFQVYDTRSGLAVNTPKSYGKSIKPSDLPDGIARFFPVPSESSSMGLPSDLLIPILEGIKENIAEIREALEGIEVRMVGGSLLLIYEADLKRAEEGVAWMKKLEEEGTSEDEEEDEDEDAKSKPGPPYLVKLIDFAHTRLKPGEGPDKGVLKGVATVLRLLEGRVEQVKVQGT